MEPKENTEANDVENPDDSRCGDAVCSAGPATVGWVRKAVMHEDGEISMESVPFVRIPRLIKQRAGDILEETISMSDYSDEEKAQFYALCERLQKCKPIS